MSVGHFSFENEFTARATELQDIAAMDRLAAELAPPSALRRWAQQRRAGQRGTVVRLRLSRRLT